MSNAMRSSDGAYDDQVVEHVLFGRARARLLEELQRDHPWSLDLETGQLVLGGGAHRAQLLGTFSTSSGTFLWAWANPEASSWRASLELVQELRKRARLPGNALFGVEAHHGDDVNPNELAYVSGELTGGHPVFVGAHDGGAVFVLVTSARLQPEETPFAFVPGLLSELADITNADPHRCSERFLERLGFAVTSTEHDVMATREDGSLRVRFDGQGRLADATLDT